MDDIDWKIIKILQQNARISFADLGKAVHLSAPAVTERVKKLEVSDVIKGYAAQVNLEKLGYAITAMVLVKVFTNKERAFVAFAHTRKEVLECYNLTGEKAFILKVTVTTMSKLDALLEDFAALSETSTMIILSQPIDKKVGKP